MSYVLSQKSSFNLGALGIDCTGWKDGSVYYFVTGQNVSGARARFLKLDGSTLSSLQQLESPNDVNIGGIDTWVGAGGVRYVAIAWLTATGTVDELRIYEVDGETLTQVAQVATSTTGQAVRVIHDAAGSRAIIALGTADVSPFVRLYEWAYSGSPSLLADTETGETMTSITRPWIAGSAIRFATGGRNGTLTVRSYESGSITTVASLNITVGNNRVRGLVHLGVIGGDEQFACALQQDNTTRETLKVVKLDESGAPALSEVVGLNPNESSDALGLSAFAAPFGAGAAADDIMLVWSANSGTTPWFRIVRYKPAGPTLTEEDAAAVGGVARGNVAIASGTDGLEILGVTASSNPEFVVFEATAPAGDMTITSIDPVEGSEDGGTAVTITGTGFVAGDEPHFGGTIATSIVVENATTITCDTPAGTVGWGVNRGKVDVTVERTGADPATLPLGYEYLFDGRIPVDAEEFGVGALANGTARAVEITTPTALSTAITAGAGEFTTVAAGFYRVHVEDGTTPHPKTSQVRTVKVV